MPKHHRRYAAHVGGPATTMTPQRNPVTNPGSGKHVNAVLAADELAQRLHRVRLGFATTSGSRANAREHAWANEFINDLLAAGWTPPADQEATTNDS